jgi:hypothetical protein
VVEPTRRQIRALDRENRQWSERLVEVPREFWPVDGMATATGSIAQAVWRSRRFLVVVWDQGGTTRLSIQRTDFDPRARHQRDGITWDDLQRLKAEAGYGDATAVEIYPPDARKVNVANIRHLFLVDAPAFMW